MGLNQSILLLPILTLYLQYFFTLRRHAKSDQTNNRTTQGNNTSAHYSDLSDDFYTHSGGKHRVRGGVDALLSEDMLGESEEERYESSETMSIVDSVLEPSKKTNQGK